MEVSSRRLAIVQHRHLPARGLLSLFSLLRAFSLTVIKRNQGGVTAQEGTRRGRAAAMRVVAAVHALWLCGTEKCLIDFATDGDSANSENKARMDLLLSFSTADAVDIRSELTRVIRLEADRLVGPVD